MARKNKLQILADELEDILDKREEVEALLEPIKEKEAEIRGELVNGMLKQGFKFIRTESGLAFGITDGRTTFKVKKGAEEEAIKWAQENFPSLLSLASAKLNQVVKPMLNPPPFLEKVEGEPFLSVRTTEQE